VGITAEAGLEALNSFLRTAGITEQEIVTADGSGLSRGDFVTVAGVVKLLMYMDKHPYRQAFRDTLPVAGVDGTLRNRLKGTRAAGNVLAKTGTLSNATSLSGYVTSRGGERLVFSLIINNHPPDAEPRQLFADPLVVTLADFGGRS
jgi:D-alanyl-D-alanine carboxypeptidase/D-alanyl-D-alanine-endopeptidase (penicillin-binding protein 4)